MVIKKALEEHETEARPDWDRVSDWSDIKFLRKKIKYLMLKLKKSH